MKLPQTHNKSNTLKRRNYMLDFLKKHKIVIIVVAVDLFLYWILYYSGVVLPFINPNIEEYNKIINSAPRNIGQMVIWMLLHFPTSYVLESITRNDTYLFLSVIQTGVITYFIEKFIQRRKSPKHKS
jgi:hypothetical protein